MSFVPFLVRSGAAAAMPAANVDTDVIMPKQFLKGIDRAGLDRGLFHGLRFDADGAPNPEFVLNNASWADVRFLVVGPNFGCGSSREHAVWGLRQFGIEALVGASYAGIFFDNCARNGLLAIESDEVAVEALMSIARDPRDHQLTIDLPNQTIAARGRAFQFDIDTARKEAISRGLDTIGLTLESRGAIAAFEARHHLQNPWLEP
jgi:3-isopropylmalate/(R)-2-methylmalate dehydratase small subunit